MLPMLGGKEQGEGEKEEKKKMVQLKKKELPLAMGTICSGLCLWDSRESLVAGSDVQGWCCPLHRLLCQGFGIAIVGSFLP